MKIVWLGVIVFATLASAQQKAATRSITAVGSATISVTPDLARVDLGVTTQAGTAQDASTQNASQVSAVISAVQSVLGPAGQVKTLSYSLNPVYNNPPAGQNASVIGYTATNIVEATITNLTLIGRVIDAGIAAGANRVQGITFGLQNEDPVRAQALKAAAAQARTQADAIASGLNVHTGNVLHASEGVTINNPVVFGIGASAAATPVLPGQTSVQASVTIEVEITA